MYFNEINKKVWCYAHLYNKYNNLIIFDIK